jgi:hypothetical protein
MELSEQVSILQDVCTTLSNGVVVFTCEDEISYVNGDGGAKAFEIVDQLVEISNLVLYQPAELSEYLITTEIASSSALSNYLASMTREDDTAPSESDLTYVDLYPVGVQIVMPSGGVLLPNPLRLSSWYECGSVVRPRPRRAMPAVLVGEVKDPAATLSSWGYHRTPGMAGGGWTRPRTYNPAVCGISTYRDHAFVGLRFTYSEDTACEFRWPIREQNYVDAPYGEPNPEVWRSGPWPYATWPAYVVMWHLTR